MTDRSEVLRSSERLAPLVDELEGWVEATVEEADEGAALVAKAMLDLEEPLDTDALDRALEAVERLEHALLELRALASVVDYLENPP